MGRSSGERRLNPAYCISPNANVLDVVVYTEGSCGVGGSLTLHDEYQPPSPSHYFLPAVLKACMGPILRRYGELML